MESVVRIGTRGSDLALAQARQVGSLLQQRRGVGAALTVLATAGDRDHHTALHELTGSGFFTKELQRALLCGDVDMVVHSLKDLPTEEPEGLELAAVLARVDPADVLLARPGQAGGGPLGLRPGARLGTSSLRRAAQALALAPEISVAPLRGNVPTRLARLRSGDFDAIVVAAAGLHRLASDLSGLVVRRLDPTSFLPAPGQGALAVEVRSGESRSGMLAASLADATTTATTSCERALLRALGGGCHLPLGALAVTTCRGIELHAALGTLDAELTRAEVRRCRVCGRDGGETAARALAALDGVPA
jgi:hydroxymethylbilane synthase